jgi:hypothetical protein
MKIRDTVYCKQLCLILQHDYQTALHATKKTYETSHSIGDTHTHTHTHSRTPLIRIKRDGEPSGYAENSDKCIFLWKQATLAAWISAVTIYSMYLRLNVSTTRDLKSYHCTVLDPITCNLKTSSFCTLLDKFIRRADPIQIIGDPDNQRSDKWSITVR